MATNSIYNTIWEKGRKTNEIDFLIRESSIGPFLPLEVKWSDSITSSDLKVLVGFLEKDKYKQAIMTTKTIERREIIDGIDVRYTPAALYAMVYGFSSIEGRMANSQTLAEG